MCSVDLEQIKAKESNGRVKNVPPPSSLSLGGCCWLAGKGLVREGKQQQQTAAAKTSAAKARFSL
jgi:hypothetical protein